VLPKGYESLVSDLLDVGGQDHLFEGLWDDDVTSASDRDRLLRQMKSLDEVRFFLNVISSLSHTHTHICTGLRGRIGKVCKECKGVTERHDKKRNKQQSRDSEGHGTCAW